MDTLRGTFDTGITADDSDDWDAEGRAHGENPDANSPTEGTSRELPPEAIGQDERRMQVRAYNHWASLLGEATFPSIEDLEPRDLTDFGPNSVLLDFSTGIEDPGVQYLGDKLAEECGAASSNSATPINKLSDVPSRSLLSRITDHYMQILANQAPIGFEAEFVNQRGASILYRGILLPYSSDDETIDFIYGVINWKEMADAATADELLLEIDQALESAEEQPVEDEDQPHKHHADPVTEWADSPAHEPEAAGVPQVNPISDPMSDPLSDNVASLSQIPGPASFDEDAGANGVASEDAGDLPMPDFGQYALDDPETDEFGEEVDEDGEGAASYSFASLADYIEAPTKKVVDLDAGQFDPDDYQVEDSDFSAIGEPDHTPLQVQPAADFTPVADFEPAADFTPATEIEPAPADAVVSEAVISDAANSETTISNDAFAQDAGLHDCLASARELAQSASASEDRSRHALYAAVGRAYDFSLASKDEPEEYNELIEDSGLTVQDRAPMTPIVKLVFGHDYDKTRLTEYAAVLSHAHRLELDRGSLSGYLSAADGGLKGVVNAERRLRREESGKEVEPEGDVRAQLAKKLRELEELTLEALSGEGPEFSLVMVRRDGAGNVALIGEIDDDLALIERAGKKLVG
jgi:hypothetical protein